jgi:hypothetical protein
VTGATANRARYIDQLARREPEIWEQVAVHILKRQPNDYARAVGLLTDTGMISQSAGARGPNFRWNLRRSGRHTPAKELLTSTCQGKLVDRLIVTTSKQSSRTAHCDAGVTRLLGQRQRAFATWNARQLFRQEQPANHSSAEEQSRNNLTTRALS